MNVRTVQHMLSDGTPLPYCTCMMVRSAVTPSINSHEYCACYIGNVSFKK